MTWTPNNTEEIAPLEYPGGVSPDFCPGAGEDDVWLIPKGLVENIAWRREILKRAEPDEVFRNEVLLPRLRRSPVLAFNLLFYTYTFFDYTDDGRQIPAIANFKERPFITWPCQDREILRVHRAFQEGRHIWGLKSRSMGWTWIMCCYAVWLLMFHEHVHIGIASRKEEEVYKPGDPDSLFWKLEFNLSRRWIPEWIPLPDIDKDMSKLHIANPNTGSSIDGESTNSNMGRSGRRSIYIVDEAAAIDNLEAIDESLCDNSGTLVYISTPSPGSYFNSLSTSPAFERAEMPWYEHPGKGRGRRMEPSKRHNMQKRWTSAWYKVQEETRSPANLAKEVDMDLAGSGRLVFDPAMIRSHIHEFGKKPERVGEIMYCRDNAGMLTADVEFCYEADDRLRRRKVESIVWKDCQFGPWKLWLDLEIDASTGMLRPPQDTLYVAFSDPGEGQGRANTTISIYDVAEKRKVAEFCSAFCEPHHLSRILVAAALWFGGKSSMLIGWENNGPGGGIKKILVDRLKYRNCYRKIQQNRKTRQKTQVYGWANSVVDKGILLRNYADLIESGVVKNHSIASLEESMTFIYSKNGRIIQSKLVDESTSAQESHGDRTIADAGAVMLIDESPKFMKTQREASPLDWHTPAGLEKIAELEEQAANANRT